MSPGWYLSSITLAGREGRAAAVPEQPWCQGSQGFLLKSLRLHPPLLTFGSASRGHEEPNFAGSTEKLFFSYRRDGVTKLCFDISAVPNHAADWKRRNWRFPSEGRKSKNITLCTPLFLSVCPFHLLCPRRCLQDTGTALSLSSGNNSSRRKGSHYAPVNDLLSAVLWNHALGNVALECNVSFPFHVLHDYCLYHDTDDIHSLGIQ